MTAAKSQDSIQELIKIMAKLRSPEGCQWDRKQTPESLKQHILEEAYELVDAITMGDPQDICDELGDLLLQVVFQAQIFSETNLFNIQDVAKSICSKLVRRHPHIYAAAEPAGHEQRWEKIKQSERAQRGKSNSLAARIPNNLPALQRASKVATKTSPGCATEHLQEINDQLTLLRDNLSNEVESQNERTGQFGRILFSLAHLACSAGVDAEAALRQTTTDMIAKIDSQKDLL